MSLQKCLSDRRLPPSAFKVYYYLCTCSDTSKTRDEIGSVVKLSKSTVRSAIELLKDCGYISVQKMITAKYSYDILEG